MKHLTYHTSVASYNIVRETAYYHYTYLNKYIYTATCIVALVLSASYNGIQLVKVLANIQYIMAS